MTYRTSIGRHITLHLVILMTVMVIIYSLTITKVYQWGLDDNAHYFLSLEADRVLDSLQHNGRLPSATAPDTHYFADPVQLPSHLLTIFPLAQHRDGELLTAHIGDDTLYLLPYRHPDTGRFFYVSHVYHAALDVYDVSPTIPQLLSLLAIGTVIVVTLLVMYLVWSIIQPVKTLERWARDLRADTAAHSLPIPPLKFTELQTVSERLQDTVVTLAQQNQREKDFLRTLSHELRTPLSIIKAALTLLERKANDLDASQQRKLELIQRANANMLATTESLLWLWIDPQRPLTKDTVDVRQMITAIVQQYQHLLQGKHVELVLWIPDSLCYRIESKLFSLTISNLIRNAFQYTEVGKIEIHADTTTITIKNLIADLTDATLSSLTNSTDFGYGVGLYLVETICAQCGWGLHIQHQDGAFTVNLQLPDNAICA